MPTISMFYGIIIRMYYDEHNPPHIHAFYNNNVAMIDFNGNKLNGNLPSKQMKLIRAWCIIHKEELKANWILSKNCEKIFDINPLK